MFTKNVQELKVMRKEMENLSSEKYHQIRQLEAEIAKIDIVIDLVDSTIDEMELEIEVEPLDFE